MKRLFLPLLLLCSTSIRPAAQISPTTDPLIQFQDCYLENNVNSFAQYNVYEGAQIAVNPKNPKIIVSFANNQDFWLTPSVSSGSGVSESPTFYSHDGGKTWNLSFIPLGYCNSPTIPVPGLSDSISISAIQYSDSGKCGTAHIISNFNDRRHFRVGETPDRWSGMAYSKSTDGGVTWTKPVIIDHGIATAVPVIQGFAQNAGGALLVDPTNPCTLYGSFNYLQRNTAPNIPQQLIRFTRSTDNGDTWAQASTIYDPAQDPSLNQYIGRQARFPFLAVYASKKEHVVFDAFTRSYQLSSTSPAITDIAFIRSFDKGKTWEQIATQIAPYTVSTLRNPSLPNVPSNNIEHNFNEPRLVVDQCRKIVYALWDGADATGNTAIFLSVSHNLGETWTHPLIISRTNLFAQNSNANQAFSAFMAITKKGTLGIVYYDFRNYVTGSTIASTDVWLDIYKPVGSATGGSTGVGLDFIKEFRLTPQSFDLNPMNDSSFSSQLNLGGLDNHMGLTTFNENFYATFGMNTQPVNNALITHPANKPLAFIDNNHRVDLFFAKVCKQQYNR